MGPWTTYLGDARVQHRPLPVPLPSRPAPGGAAAGQMADETVGGEPRGGMPADGRKASGGEMAGAEGSGGVVPSRVPTAWEAPGGDRPGAETPGGAVAAFEAGLARLGGRAPLARALLSALAWSKGPGLPRELWVTVARALLSGSPLASSVTGRR